MSLNTHSKLREIKDYYCALKQLNYNSSSKLSKMFQFLIFKGVNKSISGSSRKFVKQNGHLSQCYSRFLIAFEKTDTVQIGSKIQSKREFQSSNMPRRTYRRKKRNRRIPFQDELLSTVGAECLFESVNNRCMFRQTGEKL